MLYLWWLDCCCIMYYFMWLEMYMCFLLVIELENSNFYVIQRYRILINIFFWDMKIVSIIMVILYELCMFKYILLVSV